MNSDEYFSTPLQPVKPTAALLKVSLNGAYAAIRRGEIPSIRIGQKIMIPTAQLKAMLEGQATGGHHDGDK